MPNIPRKSSSGKITWTKWDILPEFNYTRKKALFSLNFIIKRFFVSVVRNLLLSRLFFGRAWTSYLYFKGVQMICNFAEWWKSFVVTKVSSRKTKRVAGSHRWKEGFFSNNFVRQGNIIHSITFGQLSYVCMFDN